MSKSFGILEGAAVLGTIIVGVVAYKVFSKKSLPVDVNLPQVDKLNSTVSSLASQVNSLAAPLNQEVSEALHSASTILNQAGAQSGQVFDSINATASSGKGLLDAATASVGTLTDAAQGAIYSADDAAKSAQGAFDAFGGSAQQAGQLLGNPAQAVTSVLQKAQTVLQSPGLATHPNGPAAMQAATKATQLGQQAAQVLANGGDPSTLLSQGVQFANQAQQVLLGTKTA